MGSWSWWRHRRNGTNEATDEWRRAWVSAAQAPVPDVRAAAELADRLRALGLRDDDAEVEREMLEGLQQLAELSRLVEAEGLPVVETGHRVVARDLCHFSAPVSMPDDPSQPSGRLLLTNARAIFVGGARAASVPWHGVSRVLQTDRDLVLIRRDTDMVLRFRCNTYGEALRAGYLARRLSGSGVTPPAQRRTEETTNRRTEG